MYDFIVQVLAGLTTTFIIYLIKNFHDVYKKVVVFLNKCFNVIESINIRHLIPLNIIILYMLLILNFLSSSSLIDNLTIITLLLLTLLFEMSYNKDENAISSQVS